MRKSTKKKSLLVDSDSLDSSFRMELSKEYGGEGLPCFQCGTCVASCPISVLEEEFNIRRIMRMVVLGMRDQVLSNEFLWMCSTCYLCHERCPQGMRIPDLITALKNIAAREGVIPPLLRRMLSTLEECGSIYRVDEYANLERKNLNLPPIREKLEDLKTIFSNTGLREIVKKERE